jgi:hypothetical protein
MILITGPLWRWSDGNWHFITIAEDEAVKIRAHSLLNRGGFGSVKVESTINASTRSGRTVTWRTSVFPQKSGGYLLPVKAAVRREADVVEGDEVTVSLELL